MCGVKMVLQANTEKKTMGWWEEFKNSISV